MFIRTIAYILLALMVAGCGKFDAANYSSDPTPTVISDGSSIPTGDTTSDPFPSSRSIFTVLTNLHPDLPTEYEEMEMELDIGTVSGTHESFEARQGGDITLHMSNSSGQKYIRYFSSGGNVAADVEHNFWYRNDLGELVWRGVFEGATGALIVIIDGVYSDGDGGDPSDVMQGSVWFRPWQTVADTGINSQACRTDARGRQDCKNPSGPITRCWKVSLGPYDCRFSISNDGASVNSLGNRYNDQEYIKIAEFIDLSKERTFKEAY